MSIKKHGHNTRKYRSHTYTAWINMKDRCNNPNYCGYANYGGRGITYDPLWETFENFLADMGERPECIDPYSLDRRDTNGNYSKNNCRWATPTEQQLSKRISVKNTKGIKGVYLHTPSNSWYTQIQKAGKRVTIYFGKDFFEACCARKSWENSNV